MTPTEHRKITDFTPDPANANKGTERGLRALDDSLAEVGLGRSIVVDRNGYVIAGNKTQETAVDRGFEDALVVHTTGDQLVVVQRDDLDLLAADDTRARKLAYYDNRAGQLDLEWNAEQLIADMQSGLDLSGLFLEWELDTLIGKALDEVDPAQLWEGMPEFEQGDVSPIQSITVHFLSGDDVEAFAQLVGQKITPQTRSIHYPMQEKIDRSGHKVIDES
jgi:hypothetical protein